MQDSQKIGERIRELRKGLGLKQAELGEKLGIGKSTVSDWESGKREFSTSMLRPLAEALGVDMWDIIGYDSVVIDGQSSPLSRDEQDLVDVYRAVDDHGRKIIRTVADLEFERWRDELAKDDQKRE